MASCYSFDLCSTPGDLCFDMGPREFRIFPFFFWLKSLVEKCLIRSRPSRSDFDTRGFRVENAKYRRSIGLFFEAGEARPCAHTR